MIEVNRAYVIEFNERDLGGALVRRLQDRVPLVRRSIVADDAAITELFTLGEADTVNLLLFTIVETDADISVLRRLTALLEQCTQQSSMAISVIVGQRGMSRVGSACAGIARAFEQSGLRCRTMVLPDATDMACDLLIRMAEGTLRTEEIPAEGAGTSLDKRWSISAVIGCYQENPAIPAMDERLKAVFTKLGVDHEIIFINNDNRPGTDAEHLLLDLSLRDPCVIGINMSRNFQSQAGFVSGLQLATKNACVLLDGDLQDPPEMIEQFVEKWKEGYQIVYGRRVKREATWSMQIAFKLFYRLWDALSYITVPRDAGDFSLIDRVAVEAMLSCQERDLWLRGIRAFVGFRQVGVDYIRPERPWGNTSNNLLRNLHWARKGIFSFSNTPLTILTYSGFLLFAISLLFVTIQIVWKLLQPGTAPHGFTTLFTAILFFGSINLFACGILGEYIGRIFEEAKQRPLYVLRSITRYGVSHLVEAEENVPRQRLSIHRVPSLLPAIKERSGN